MNYIERFVNSDALAESKSELARNELNDCSVRAFMVALGVSYEEAHAWVASNFYRKPKDGISVLKHLPTVIENAAFGKHIRLVGLSPKLKDTFRRSIIFSVRYKDIKLDVLCNPRYKNKEVAYTVKSFIENHKTGSYYLGVDGHALAVKDGVLYGNEDENVKGLRRRVRYALEIK